MASIMIALNNKLKKKKGTRDSYLDSKHLETCLVKMETAAEV